MKRGWGTCAIAIAGALASNGCVDTFGFTEGDLALDASTASDGAPTADAGAEADTGVESDTGVDADTDAGVEADTGADADTGVDADASAEADTGADADTGVDADASVEVDTGLEADASADADAAADTDTGVDADTGLEADTGADTDTGVEADATDAISAGQNGAACGFHGDCVSGVCTEGVCCNSSCGSCHSCLGVYTGKADGVCAVTRPGFDPKNECTDLGAASCSLDGTCDGLGGCRYYPIGTVCETPSCAGGSVVSHTCGGIGNCGATTTACGAGETCSNGVCVTP